MTATRAPRSPRDLSVPGATVDFTEQEGPAMTIEIGPVFEKVISAWDEPLRCQTQRSRRLCRNPARWLGIDSHCGRHGQPDKVLLCTFHKTQWLRSVWAKIACWGFFRCGYCGQHFTAPEQTVTFRPV